MDIYKEEQCRYGIERKERERKGTLKNELLHQGQTDHALHWQYESELCLRKVGM